MKKKQKSALAKRIFIGIDLFVIASVLMLMPKSLWLVSVLYLYLVYFRANLSVMIFRRECKAIFGALIMALTGIYMAIETNLMFGDYQGQFDSLSKVLLRYTENEQFAVITWLILFGWFFFVPMLNSIGQLFYKQKTNTARWYDIFTLTYYKLTPWRKEIIALFLLSVVTVIAQVVGLIGETNLDSLWSVPLSMQGGWLLLMALGIDWRKIPRKWLYIIISILLLLSIWGSQYLYREKLIVLIISYILGLVVTYIIVQKNTQDSTLSKVVASLAITFVTFIALPIFAFGYNVFSGTDYLRTAAFKNVQYADTPWQKRLQEAPLDFIVSRGVYYIKDRDENIGLRDRKGVIIPVEYEAIENLALPFYKVKKSGLWGVYDNSGAFMYRNYYFVDSSTQSGLLIPCSYSSITTASDKRDALFVEDCEGNKNVISIRKR